MDYEIESLSSRKVKNSNKLLNNCNWPKWGDDKVELMYFNCDSISIVSNSISIVFLLLHVFQFQLIELMYFNYWFISISLSIIKITLNQSLSKVLFSICFHVQSIENPLSYAVDSTLSCSKVSCKLLST